MAESMGEEREARMTLAALSNPGDIITGTLVARLGAAETVRLITSGVRLPNGVELALQRSLSRPGGVSGGLNLARLTVPVPVAGPSLEPAGRRHPDRDVAEDLAKTSAHSTSTASRRRLSASHSER